MTSRLPAPCAVVFVADLERVTDFYRQVAAMMVAHEDASHVVLELQGFQLVVHSLSGESAVHPDEHARVPVREDSYIKLCLPVVNIAAARARAIALGGSIKPAEQEWQARGFRACDGHDPEGNVFQVREHVNERGVGA